MAGCAGKTDAAEYTQAVLDLTFQGDAESARKIMKDAAYQDLMQLYTESVDTFTTSAVTNSLDIDDEDQGKFCQLVADIFQTMRYRVKDGKKIKRNEYEVSVAVYPADIFLNFRQLLTADSLKIAQDVREGKYTGTEDEINAQVMDDIVNHTYEILDSVRKKIKYGKEITVALKVKEEKNGEYSVDSDDMNALMMKILRLDEM